ncbi:hypothetical protein IVA88_09005 [Bradyrhizobium sp. 149]|uniref:hypothetical protein n=1 Tax=Bradyrhizobium sp. 149 TaxID=2782624 RepID=UPI001FF7FEC8|nr:hypothetical protein [Bradyrhizobium sp. 149]MCK1651574.1 hypothetical protein [Bradyrhizobium sp. 149]
MTLISATSLMSTLVLAAIVSQTNGPIVGHQTADTAAANQTSINRPASAPTTVAQGRCFNGKCY